MDSSNNELSVEFDEEVKAPAIKHALSVIEEE